MGKIFGSKSHHIRTPAPTKRLSHESGLTLITSLFQNTFILDSADWNDDEQCFIEIQFWYTWWSWWAWATFIMLSGPQCQPIRGSGWGILTNKKPANCPNPSRMSSCCISCFINIYTDAEMIIKVSSLYVEMDQGRHTNINNTRGRAQLRSLELH